MVKIVCHSIAENTHAIKVYNNSIMTERRVVPTLNDARTYIRELWTSYRSSAGKVRVQFK
jgi:hypothetical protein